MGHLLRAAQVTPNIRHQIGLVNGSPPPYRIGLYILVQQLVGIQLRAVRWKKIHLQILFLLFEPARRFARLVHRVLVYNQNHLSADLAPQTLQKPEEHPRGEPLLEYHEIKPSPVGDGRDHITAKAPACARNHRRLTPPTPGAPGLVVGSQTHLVAPVNLCSIALGPRANRRIFLLEPLPYQLGVSLVRSSQGLLWRESPTVQVASHRPHRHLDTKPASQEFPHRFPRPEHKRQLQLVRTAIADQPHSRGRLVRRKALDRRPPSPPGSQASKSAGAILFHPVVHRLTRYAKCSRRLGLVHAAPHRRDHTAAEVLLGIGRKKSGILCLHEVLYIPSQ